VSKQIIGKKKGKLVFMIDGNLTNVGRGRELENHHLENTKISEKII
jgi:hypothetical protein